MQVQARVIKGNSDTARWTKAVSLNPTFSQVSTFENVVVVQTCNPKLWEGEVEEAEVQSQS